MKIIQDFDAFTHTIANNDPEKILTLERGSLSLYWAVANGYGKRLLAEQNRVKRAANKGKRNGK